MKKLLVIGALIFGFSLQMNAQAKLSLQGGLNLFKATLSGDGASLTSSSRTSLNFGLNADFKTTKNFNLRSGLMYNGFGGTFQGVVNKLDYLTVPVLGRYKFAEGFYAYGGPQLGLLLSAKSVELGHTYDEKDRFTTASISALLGAEYHITNKISFSANYTAGLTNITKSTTDFTGKTTTSGFSLNVGYSF